MCSHCRLGGWILEHTIDGTQAQYVRSPYVDRVATPVAPDGVEEALARSRERHRPASPVTQHSESLLRQKNGLIAPVGHRLVPGNKESNHGKWEG